MTTASALTKPAQIRVARRSPAYWRTGSGSEIPMARGFHKPGDVENRLGYYLGQIAR